MKSVFRVGDRVMIEKNEIMGWLDESMDMYIGQVGTIVQVHDDLDCMVDFNDNLRIWWWHPDNFILIQTPCNIRLNFGTEYSKELSIPSDVFEKFLNKELKLTLQAI